MKFHRPLLVAGLASIGSALFVAQAQNTDAQNKALEALRKAQSGSAAVVAPAPSAVRTADSSAQEKALQALRQQQAGGGAPMVAPARAPMTSPNDTPAQKKAIEALYGKPSTDPAPSVVSSGNAAQMRAIEALRMHQTANPATVQETPAQAKALEALRSSQADMVAAPARLPKSTKAQTRAVNALTDRQELRDGASTGQAAAPRILTGKQEKLADLTRRYKADEMTPHEYHVMRAKIVSEP